MEYWKPVKNYEDLYEVSNFGNVRRIGRKTNLSLTKTDLYPKVGLSRKSKVSHKWVHRLVAEAFIQNPEGKNRVNHKNLDKHDNRVSNLEWCTQLENIHHAISKGVVKTKLTEEAVAQIRYLRKNYPEISCKQLGYVFGVCDTHISNIEHRKKWKFI